MIADSIVGQAKIPHALHRLLKDAISVRERYTDLLTHHDEVIDPTCVEIADDHALMPGEDRQDQLLLERDEMIAARADRQVELNGEIARLQGDLDALIARTPTHPPNRTLLEHLSHESEHLLTFLKTPGVSRRPTGGPSRQSAPRS